MTIKSPKHNNLNAGARMFKSISELQNFLQWCKTQGITAVKVDGVEVSFSPLAFLPADDFKEMTNGGAKTLADTEPSQEDEDDELLMWSSRP